MGAFNSSITRVWPVFDCLFHRDAAGAEWLPKLLRLANASACLGESLTCGPGPLLPDVTLRERELPAPVRRVLGEASSKRLGRIPNAYEFDVPPSKAFLRWLLEHPAQLTRPDENYGEQTRNRREHLLIGDAAVQAEGLRELERCGAAGSRRKWWAFEGFTSVDCLLETETLVLLIEGKRTEPLSSSTKWFPGRNQLVRNVEAASAHAAGKKEFAVLLCTEEPVALHEAVWTESLPHLSKHEIIQLKRHYLGCVTWSSIAKEICGGLTLPHTIEDALSLLEKLRR